MNINRMRRHNQIRQGQKTLLGWKNLGWIDESQEFSFDTEPIRQINESVKRMARLYSGPDLFIAPLNVPVPAPKIEALRIAPAQSGDVLDDLWFRAEKFKRAHAPAWEQAFRLAATLDDGDTIVRGTD